MKRTPMKRTAFRSKREGPTSAREIHPSARKEAKEPVAGTLRPLRMGVYGGSTKRPEPKTEAYRDPVLLEMARDRPCMLLVPGVCNHRTDTTVAAHSNLSTHGKAGARKADDCYSVWACFACHSWLDQGRAPATVKEAAFVFGLMQQKSAWVQITQSPDEPVRFRRAAARALHHVLAQEQLA